jgi:translation initiation factor 1
VTAVYGFQDTDTDLKKIASQLKNRCGSGGTVKDGVILIQGDHRTTVRSELTKLGYTVKLSGG